VDGQTKLIVVFHNYANAPKNREYIQAMLRFANGYYTNMPRKSKHLFPNKTHSIYFVLYSYTAKLSTAISMFAHISSVPAAACVELQDEKGFI